MKINQSDTEQKESLKDPQPLLRQRLMWFLLLWGGGILTLAAISFLLKSVIKLTFLNG